MRNEEELIVYVTYINVSINFHSNVFHFFTSIWSSSSYSFEYLPMKLMCKSVNNSDKIFSQQIWNNDFILLLFVTFSQYRLIENQYTISKRIWNLCCVSDVEKSNRINKDSSKENKKKIFIYGIETCLDNCRFDNGESMYFRNWKRSLAIQKKVHIKNKK